MNVKVKATARPIWLLGVCALAVGVGSGER